MYILHSGFIRDPIANASDSEKCLVLSRSAATRNSPTPEMVFIDSGSSSTNQYAMHLSTGTYFLYNGTECGKNKLELSSLIT